MQDLLSKLDDFILLATAILTVASFIVKLTPTPKDDAVVHQLLELLSFLKPKDVKGTFKAPFTSSIKEPPSEKDSD